MSADPVPVFDSTNRDIHALQRELSSVSGRHVLLMLTDNTSTMLTARQQGGVVELRAHRMFLDAPDEVISALGRWLGGKRIKRDLVQEFIDANEHQVAQRARETRAPVIRTSGRHHNLLELRDYLNRTYLNNRSKAPVTWGRKVTRKKVRSVRLGCYDPLRQTITISRRLDRADIPKYMVEYVLFHEMLHEVLGIGERADGRRDIHGKTFKLMEKTYPNYEKARTFERKKWG